MWVFIYNYWKCILYRKNRIDKRNFKFKEVLLHPGVLHIEQYLNLLVYKPLFKVLGSELQIRVCCMTLELVECTISPFPSRTVLTEAVYIIDFDSSNPQLPSSLLREKVVFTASKINGREMLDIQLIFDPMENTVHIYLYMCIYICKYLLVKKSSCIRTVVHPKIHSWSQLQHSESLLWCTAQVMGTTLTSWSDTAVLYHFLFKVTHVLL